MRRPAILLAGILAACLPPGPAVFAQESRQNPAVQPALAGPPESATSPGTVGQQAFRSRWVEQRADTDMLRFMADSGGRLPTEPLLTPWERFLEAVRRGLSIGPVGVTFSVGTGWEYSNRTYSGQATNQTDDNSPFVQGSIGLEYSREIGPWSVQAAYRGGLRYFLNENYTAAGTGNQRNPYYQTFSSTIGHTGLRHSGRLALSASTGTGQDTITGQPITTTNYSAGADGEYTLTSLTSLGASAVYSGSLNEQGSGGAGSGTGDLTRFDSRAFVNYLITGKTRLSFEVGAGFDTQQLSDQGEVGRRYVQTLVGADVGFTSKLRGGARIGTRYTEDENVVSPEAEGLQPAYSLDVSYNPTEKTSLSAQLSLLGAALRPGYRVSASWEPRPNTSLGLSAYQNEGFSLTVSDQVQISRGVVATVQQRFFSKVSLTLSGGYQQTENLSLSGTGEANAQSGEEFAYAFVSATLVYSLREWASLNFSIWTSNGQTTTNVDDDGETRASVSFNLTF